MKEKLHIQENAELHNKLDYLNWSGHIYILLSYKCALCIAFMCKYHWYLESGRTVGGCCIGIFKSPFTITSKFDNFYYIS